MKTRLSEKAKSRMRNEQVSPDVPKRKICQQNSAVMKEGLLNGVQKGTPSKDITKTKNETINGDIPSLETGGKKLIMLRCINREEAMEGKDFIFTVHYIDSESDFVFDSVLMSKEFANNKKYHNGIKSKCLKEVKANVVKTNDEKSPKGGLHDKEMTSNSAVQGSCLRSSNSDKKPKTKMNTKDKKEIKLEPNQNKDKEVLSPRKLENVAMDCEPIIKAVELNKSPFDSNLGIVKMAESQDQGENVKAKKHNHIPTQKIIITTDNIAKNKLNLSSPKRKGLKRNLKEEFTDALHQSKGEKRFIVEVGCNGNSPPLTESIDPQKKIDTDDNQNRKIGDSHSPQKTVTSLKDSVRNNKNESVASKSKKSLSKHSKKEQANGKEKTKSPFSGDSSSVEESVTKKSIHHSPPLIYNEKPDIQGQHTTNDSGDKLSSVASTFQTSPLKDCDNSNNEVAKSDHNASFSAEYYQFLKMPSPENTCIVSSRKSSPNSHSVNDEKDTKEIINENKSVLSFVASSDVKTVPDSEITDLTLQKQSPNTSVSPPKKLMKEQPVNRKSSPVDLNKEAKDESPTLQGKKVKVSCKKRNSSRRRTSTTESAVIAEDSSKLSHKKISKKVKEENKYCEPRVTRSSMKKLK